MLKAGLANFTSSRVKAKRTTFVFVLPRTEVSEPTTVWSTSLSSRDAFCVTWMKLPFTFTGTIWLSWGELSRSQRTLHEWFLLIW